MVTDGQVNQLRRLLGQGKSLAASARMTDTSEKTARGYRDDDRLPSQKKSQRKCRTRLDPFADVWPSVEKRLHDEPRLKAKTLFAWLQADHPGAFPDSTRRTFERRVSKWRALYGPSKTVFFSQDHQPGGLAASDFIICNSLKGKIAGKLLNHSFFHCVLTCSNVQSVSLCFFPSFEALSEGIQIAFWEFGGHSMLSTTCSLLVQQLLIAKRNLRLPKLNKQLLSNEGLIIDDLGYVLQSREEMEVLFMLLAERYERGSVLLTSNLAFSKWDQIFKDAMTTAAAIDWLTHHSVIIELNVPS